MPKREQILVGLDIGTTKICAIVAEITETGSLNVIGVGSSPSRGLRKGVVVNIESTVESIKKAVDDAELMAGVEIHSVYTGIAGGHIGGENCKGVVVLKKQEVTREDVQRAVDSARTMAVIPQERRVLHVLPREFMVDDQDGIRDPVGLLGTRLEVNVHIITGAVTSAQNLIKGVNRAGLDVVDIVLQPLASSEAVLSPEEKELGVAMVDFGGGTTDLAIFLDGSVRHTAVLPLGGQNLTKDLAIGLLTSQSEAEKIKLQYGIARADLLQGHQMVEVPSVGDRPARMFTRRDIADILEPRVEEMFELFGFFLLVLIGMELLTTLRAYVYERVIHAEVVLEVALIAIAQKVIVLDTSRASWATLLGLAALVLALAAAIWAVRFVRSSGAAAASTQ